jgi:hypothetical protein
MKGKLFYAPAIAVILALLPVPLAAQWLNFKTPGIPRTADGKPDLSAPIPRTVDGKPDLSGIWRAPANPLNNRYLRNIAVDLKPGEILPWAHELYQQHVFDLEADSPHSHCLPFPPPVYHLVGMSRIVQTPTLTVIINEANSGDVTRTVFTDGRGLPEEMNPTWLGYSVGHWEGDTFVVTTAGFNDRSWLDSVGYPHSEALRITERFHRRDFGHMDFEITLEDPKTFTRPITFRADKTLAADTELLETICEYHAEHAQHVVGGKRFRLSPEMLASYAGTYEFAPGRDAVVTVDDQLLVLHLSATGEVEPLASQSETLFMSAVFGDQVEFIKDSSGAVTGLILHTGTGDGIGNRPLTEQKAVRKQ